MNLKEIRKAKGLTQRQVEKATGIAPHSYRHIENGRRTPNADTAQRLGTLLGFDWTEFFCTKKDRKQITVVRKSDGEVLAVISGNEIIEKDDIEVILT